MSFETGNTRIAGMGEDLHLAGLKFNLVSAIYFVGTYFLMTFECCTFTR